MTEHVDLEAYKHFVDTVTSIESKDFDEYTTQLNRLQGQGCNLPRLDMAITGLLSESGEAGEILKHLKFHGEDWNEDVKYHLQREAGDIIWYWMNFCMALDMKPEDVIAMNVDKLEKRYPGGKFSAYFSANRKEGDI